MRHVLALALCLSPGLAWADDLDRYRAANEMKAEIMAAFYIARVPEMAEVLPEMGWDDEIAAVAQCTLDGVRAERGAAGVEEYLAALEAWGPVVPTSFMTMADGQPAVLSDDLAMRLVNDCGGLTLAMARMEASGMLEMIQRPDVMERLIAAE